MSRRLVFSSESVGEGHPDKVCDAISDAVLDACLAQDPQARVACETLAKSSTVVIAGEITSSARLDVADIARTTIRDIGYVHADDAFHADRVDVRTILTQQARDIAQGVDAAAADGKLTDEQGAGDQGLMFGYACDETPELMPIPITLAHALVRELAALRKSGALPWLRPDAKAQVSVEFEDHVPVRVSHVVLSTQHADGVAHGDIREACRELVIRRVLPASLLDPDTRILVNPTGRFVEGGPQADTGLTGRKIIVDSYGGWSRHGGGAFSGKDPSKVDRSAAYMARYIAKNVVAAGLAKRCEVQLAYAIGHPDPVSVRVDTFGTGRASDAALTRIVREVFPLKPAGIIRHLDLLRPIYSRTTQYGHFGKSDPDLAWERVDAADALRHALR